MNWMAAVVVLLILARWLAELWLERLNRRHVLAHAGAVPEAFKDVVDEATYAKSVQYTLAKGRFGQIEDTWHAAVLLVVLFSGVLPWGFHFLMAGWARRRGRWRRFCSSPALRCRCRACRWIGMISSGWKNGFGFNTTTQRALVDGPAQRAAAAPRAGLPAAGAGAEAGRVDGGVVVAVGLGRAARVSTADDRAGAGADPAAVQQVHAAARRQPARAAA